MATPSEVAAQRLAEAPAIEHEWNNMSYKDRAAWWMSAKWYGYMSKEAYCRGDASSNADESARYGEPGFFIATRVPYFEVAAAAPVAAPAPAVTPQTASEPAAPTSAAETAVAPVAASVETPAVEAPVKEAETVVAPPIAIPATTESKPAEESPVLSALPPTSHKKKKSKHSKSGGADKKDGKTIQIKLGK